MYFCLPSLDSCSSAACGLIGLPADVCGIDEAGRGPLAGPVVAAAVMLYPSRPVLGLNDSKKLSAKRRELLAGKIRKEAVAFCVAKASVEEIDRLNILQATFLAMRRAVKGLGVKPLSAVVDGNRTPMLDIPVEAVVKGDGKIAAVAAASILAKTARDAMMRDLHEIYPQYGFDRHMGYPTPLHLEMLRLHGVSPHHRLSFAPVAKVARGLSFGTLRI